MTEENGLNLEQIAEKIEKGGLPSVEQMRAETVHLDPVEQKRKAFEERYRDLQAKVPEYNNLVGRWKNGEELLPEEMTRMGDLSDEFAQFIEKHNMR